MKLESYNTITKAGESSLKIKGSKFLGFALQIGNAEQLKSILERFKEEHPNCNHICYAYLINSDQEYYRANDDGEPSGTAGLPILGQIKSKELFDTIVLVVRYFGGTKLGTSGLKEAYKIAAKEAIENATTGLKKITTTFEITFSYDDTNEINALFREVQAKIISQEYDTLCKIKFEVATSMANQVQQFCVNKRNLDIRQLNA